MRGLDLLFASGVRVRLKAMATRRGTSRSDHLFHCGAWRGERELQRQLRRAVPALLVALGRGDDVRPAHGDAGRCLGELRPEGPRPALAEQGVSRLVPPLRDRQPLPLVPGPRPPRDGDARRNAPRLLRGGAPAGRRAEGDHRRIERLSRGAEERATSGSGAMNRSMIPWHRIVGLALTDLFTGRRDRSPRHELTAATAETCTIRESRT